MRISNDYVFNEHPIGGSSQPEVRWSTEAPGTTSTWTTQTVGTHIWRKVADGHVQELIKVKDDNRADDWVVAQGLIAQRIDFSEFTDGGSTTGTLVLDATIPQGAFFVRAYLVNNTAATDVTTLTIQIGDGTDADRYTTGTPSVAAAADIIDLGVPSGTDVHVDAIATVTVTLTEDDDFTDVTAWAATVIMEYTGVLV